ncbi:MBL fold metallo-hydrolase [Trichocoleus sp. FACHB-591]|uniref:MBL fold metallo-hydrolase n=1 Tax=Trichocoleus sp. FACHB-591 TaxID=2692872 RepID=UPI00351C32B1
MVELECLPYGAGQAGEGVCLLVRMGPYRILLDCGLQDVSPLVVDADRSLPADLVLCTHAHLDHARGLLALHQAFPQLPIYASEVTTELLPFNWPELDPAEIPPFCQALPWRSPIEFQEGLTAELWPAGHLPGAAAFLLTYTTPHRTYTVFYTGDCFLSNSRLVEGFPLEELRGLRPDVLIVEGSYGTSRHPRRRQQENQLAERVSQAITEGYSVLLPTPTLGLGQELLMLLRSHHHFTGRDLNIWVSGTVAAACDAYIQLLPHLPTTVQNFAQHQPLFWDERVRPRVRRLHTDPIGTAEELRTGDLQPPCIILTDATADLSQYCRPGNGPWLLMLPQQLVTIHSSSDEPFLAERSQRHRQLVLSQSRTVEKKLQAEIRSGRLAVETYLLADHCDGPGTTQLIHNLRPQHVVFVHSSPTYLSDLTSLDELHNRYHLHSPASGTVVELPVGETFLQPAAPETSYEGELTELGTVVTITLPDAITVDTRWHNFADTGLIEARWQGEELVLRGLPQWELLTQGSDRPAPVTLDCCGNCQHYRGQRCWNQTSPLFDFKVAPEGYCPVFEPIHPESPSSSSPLSNTLTGDLEGLNSDDEPELN